MSFLSVYSWRPCPSSSGREWVYFWALRSVPFVGVSVFTPVLIAVICKLRWHRVWEVSGFVPLETPRDLRWFRRILKTVLFLGRRLFGCYQDCTGLWGAPGSTDASAMLVLPGRERGLPSPSSVPPRRLSAASREVTQRLKTRESAFPESSWGTGQ